MTLEEEAEEYAEKHAFRIPYDGSNKFYDDVDFKASKEGFLQGAELGYNKANEWHFVKDGALPDEDVYVYLLFKGQKYPIAARRHLFKEWGRLKWCWDCKWGSGYTIEADNDKIIAWKEIVLPKE